MNKFYTILIAILLTATAYAQAPDKMSYQAIVRDSGDNLVSNQLVGIQISILQGNTAVYEETQNPTTNSNGLLSIEIGGDHATVVSGIFANIDWNAGTYFIKTETDPTGGNNYTITGTSQLLGVPYALHAKTATKAITADNGIPVGGKEGQVLRIVDGSPVWVDYVGGDFDGDGYSVAQGDCDDNDPNTFPGAAENDSLTECMKDSDGDGYGDSSVDFPGTDCNDNNASIYPGAIEVFGDGIDNNCNDQTDELQIGSVRDGGVVFYIPPTPTDLDGDGKLDYGLVCSMEDLISDGIQWYNGVYLDAGRTSWAMGGGSTNTDLIISAQGLIETDYAAGLARAYTGGNFTNWFLPSFYELKEMYQNKTILNQAPGFTPFISSNSGKAYYWSSSEQGDINYAPALNFSSGNQLYANKSQSYSVRAIRAF